MKFLLVAVNAKYIHSNPAIYSLRAYAGQELRPHIELAKYTINQQLQDILADIYLRRPDVIGFSCYIWNWNVIRELLDELPKILPDADIWLGGPEVTYDAPRILQMFPGLTGIMVGEGEATFRELVQRYADRETKACAGKAENDFSDIAGLCLREGITMPRPLMDLSEIPFLYEDLEPFANRIIYYESSRGCPYRCSYCLSSIDKKVRLRDIGIVKKELQFFLDHKVKQVKFVDRTFNCDHAHAMEIWQYILEHDNGVTNFHFEISADILRAEEIELLSRFRPGLAQFEIGVQSTNEETLRAIHRSMHVQRLEKIVEAIREGRNIHQHLDLIAGLPYEDYESFGHSFDRVYAMKPDQLQLGFLKVLSGAPISQQIQEYGIV
ncbi:MAG: B12-binding domain-containing radical SAM protein, partial [Lachnospiraceae bacterium]|nr:B12-binding domain-containing radical SAM protein [Lachnospiraceae bacterium]